VPPDSQLGDAGRLLRSSRSPSLAVKLRSLRLIVRCCFWYRSAASGEVLIEPVSILAVGRTCDEPGGDLGNFSATSPYCSVRPFEFLSDL